MVKLTSWIKLRMTDREYAEMNVIMSETDVDIDDGREMAIYFLKLAGVKTDENP